MKNKYKQGFSLIEIILAIAVFVIFSSGAVAVILQGISANRLGKEQTIATEYAAEGLEAIRSIKNQSFSSLISTPSAGVTRSLAGTWIFSGTSNTFDGRYTRTIAIADVYRDGSGNIVGSGGTLDSNTKKITSTVTWNFAPARSDSVILSTYLTNWRASAPSCAVYCTALGGYSTGTCRQNTQQCTLNGETYEPGGDTYCTGGPSGNTCCCK